MSESQAVVSSHGAAVVDLIHAGSVRQGKLDCSKAPVTRVPHEALGVAEQIRERSASLIQVVDGECERSLRCCVRVFKFTKYAASSYETDGLALRPRALGTSQIAKVIDTTVMTEIVDTGQLRIRRTREVHGNVDPSRASPKTV